MELTPEEQIRIALKRSGHTIWDISKKMDMGPTAFHNRLAGHIPFSEEEWERLQTILGELNLEETI